MAIKPLTIKDWELGVGTSPYTGFGQMVNVDVFSQPGSVLISNRLESDPESVGVVDELIKWNVQDPVTGDNYLVDRNGKLYKRDRGTSAWTVITGHGNTAANGEGLAIWEDYLFYARRTRLDVYGPLSGAPTWTNNWQTLESSAFYNLHPMLLSGQRFVLYIGNAEFVDTIEEVAGQTFDPSNGATFIYNLQDLELGSYYRITCLEEVGNDIAIGTQLGANRGNTADMFFWDGFSDAVAGGKTIRFVENGVKMTKNVQNTLFTMAGDGIPRLFQSVTSQAQEVKRLNNISVPIFKGLSLFPDAIEQKEGELLFGIGHSRGVNGPFPMGVYSLRNGGYVLRHLISTGNDGSSDNLVIGSIKTLDSDRILVSWQDNVNPTNFGVDILTKNFYTDYTAYIESPLYTIGTEADPTTLSKVEVRMGKKLNAGDGIRIKARKNLTDPFTLVATFDTTYVGRDNFELNVANIGGFVEAQFRIELTIDEDSEVSPELKEVVFT